MNSLAQRLAGAMLVLCTYVATSSAQGETGRVGPVSGITSPSKWSLLEHAIPRRCDRPVDQSLRWTQNGVATVKPLLRLAAPHGQIG